MEIRVGDWVFEALVDGPSDGELVLLLHGFPESAAEWHAVLPQGVVAGAPIGHDEPNVAIPLGCLARVADGALTVEVERVARAT